MIDTGLARMEHLIDAEQHLVVICSGCSPPREVRLTPWEACATFGRRTTHAEAVSRARCSECDARGSELSYPIQMRADSQDHRAKYEFEDAARQASRWPNDRFSARRLEEARAKWEARRPRPPEENG